MNTISVDVDLDDILDSMRKSEKQELVDELFREGYVPKKYRPAGEDYFGSGAETTLEKELLKTLYAVWDNRVNLNEDDVKHLIQLAKK